MYIENRILPMLGHFKLSQIGPRHSLKFLEDLQETGARKDGKEGQLSVETVRFYHWILKNIFSSAVEWRLIKENPVSGVKKPDSVHSASTSIYTQEQVEKMLEYLKEEKPMWRVMFTLAVVRGMRRSELLGLEWKHVNMLHGTIRVEQSLMYTKEKKFLIKEPKTKNSKRLIALPKSVLPLLNEYYKTCLD